MFLWRPQHYNVLSNQVTDQCIYIYITNQFLLLFNSHESICSFEFIEIQNLPSHTKQFGASQNCVLMSWAQDYRYRPVIWIRSIFALKKKISFFVKSKIVFLTT